MTEQWVIVWLDEPTPQDGEPPEDPKPRAMITTDEMGAKAAAFSLITGGRADPRTVEVINCEELTF